MHSKSLAAAVLLPLAVSAQQSAYGQCGGIGWSGATTCVANYTCTVSNPYYSQCLPGGNSSPTPAKTTTTTTTTSKATTFTTVKTTSTTTLGSSPPPSTTVASPSTTVVTGAGPGTTLTGTWLWIRSVEAPNFHKYLQTSPEYTTGTAIMGDYTTAGQFNIVNGQLVENIGGGKQLYAVVTPRQTTELLLAVTFSATPNTYGTFAFQGDAVTWTIPSISRPNTAAWYVCTGQQLFINLGNYDYGTPANCADETIHYYNGATAVD